MTTTLPPAIELELERLASTPTVPELRARLRPDRSWSPEQLLFVTGQTRDELIAGVDDLLARLESTPRAELAELARTTRPEVWHEQRAAVVAASADEAIQRLRLIRRKLPRHARLSMPSGSYFAATRPVGATALLFPGQGCQYPRMLVHLALRVPEVARWLAELDHAFVARGQDPPSRLLLEPATATVPGLVDLRTGAQLGLVCSLALHELLDTWGLRPDLLVGHSNGEHAALVAGNVFRFLSKRWLTSFFCAGGLLLDGLERPSAAEDVIAVGGAAPALLDEVLAAAPGELFLAIDNCPRQQVLAGTARQVAAAKLRLEATGASVMRVPIGRAYHTPLFEPCAATLRRHYEVLVPGERRLPVISCLYGEPHPADPDRVRDWTADQWRNGVNFRQTIERLYEQGVRHFVEVGPDDSLSPFVRDTLHGREVSVAAASSRRRDDLLQLKHLLAQLAVFGPELPPAAIAWFERLDAGEPLADAHEQARRASLPSRSTTRIRTGIATGVTTGITGTATGEVRRLHEQLVARARTAQQQAARWLAPVRPAAILDGLARAVPGQTGLAQLSTRTHPWLLDHAFGRATDPDVGAPLAVLSFTTSMACVAELATAALGSGPVRQLREIKARRWLALDGGELPLRYELVREADGWLRVRLWDDRSDDDEPAFEAVAGTARPTLAPMPTRGPAPSRALDLLLRRFYQDVAFHGPSFRALERVDSHDGGHVHAQLIVRAPSPSHVLDPAVWDCLGQLAAICALEHDDAPFGLYPLWAERCCLTGVTSGLGARLQLDAHVESLGVLGTRTHGRWLDANGRELGRIEGLTQRRVALHPVIHQLLRAPPARRAPGDARDGIDPELAAWLADADPLWTRVLASCCLPPAAHHAWLRAPAPRRLAKLLQSLRSPESPWCLS